MNCKKVFSGVCALSILASGIATVSFADDLGIKQNIHKFTNKFDFSTVESLTDAQVEELSELQNELNGYIEKQKEVKTKMSDLISEYGIEDAVKPEKCFFDSSKLESLTDEQKETITSLKDELKSIAKNKRELVKNSELTDEQKEILEEYKTNEKEVSEKIKSLLEEYGVKVDENKKELNIEKREMKGNRSGRMQNVSNKASETQVKE